jgi:hypothetical protein
MEAIWEGVFPGCLLYPVHQPEGGFESYLHQECASFNSRAWRAAELVFSTGQVRTWRDAFTGALNREKSQYSNDEHGVSEFVVRNRTRRRIAPNPLQVYSNDVLPLTPGLSKSFVSLAAQIPYHLRAHHRLYRHIYARRFPTATKVPVVSGSTAYTFDSRPDKDVLLGKFGLLINRHYRIATMMRRLGSVQGAAFWESSRLVDAAVRDVDPTHDDLNADRVRMLQAAQPPHDALTSTARELLFYWHSWKAVMGGIKCAPFSSS